MTNYAKLPTWADKTWLLSRRKKEPNARIFVVPDRSPFEADLRLPKRAVKEVELFFEATDALEEKKLEFLGMASSFESHLSDKKYSK